MNIKDLVFKTNLAESHRILGSQGAIDNTSDVIRKHFFSPTGQLIGTIDAFSSATAIGTSAANVSVSSDTSSNTVNQISIGYGTSTTAFATTPGT